MCFVKCPTEITHRIDSAVQLQWHQLVWMGFGRVGFFLEFFVDAGAFPPTFTDASDPYGIVLIGRLSSHDCRTGLPSKEMCHAACGWHP